MPHRTLQLVVSNPPPIPLPDNKGSSSINKRSPCSRSPTLNRSSPRSNNSPGVMRLVRQIAAQLIAIGHVRPNMVTLESRAVAELFRVVCRRRPVAMRLDDAPAAAPKRRRHGDTTLVALAHVAASLWFG